MKKRISILILLVIGMIIFVSVGFPLLRSVKSDIKDNETNELNFTNKTVSEVDKVKEVVITNTDLCKDSQTGEIDIQCQSEQGCDNLCQMRGCQVSGLSYNGSKYDEDKCVCLCNE
ncbi:MAG: hypothetical protein ACQESF_05615 [Nanobdellota archaeon]